MATHCSSQSYGWSRRAICLTVLAATLVIPSAVWAFGGFRQSVGGIRIDLRGAVSNAERDQMGRLREMRIKEFQPVPGELNQPTRLRKISLRALNETIGECLRAEKPLPDEIKCLAGLQRVEYVFVYPEENDIVLAGYGEGWQIDVRGNMVGVTTGRPVLLLDDLLVALRTAERAARGGITCSIDPTKEGLARLQAGAVNLAALGSNPKQVAEEIERQLGPQTVTITGVPGDTHFARVLLAADFRMKRLGMGFEPSPVRGLPSYLQLLKRGGKAISQNMLPRWWLTTDYDPLLTDGEGLAWQLRGRGVKAMTEDDFVTAQGDRQRTGKPSPQAQKWADAMTERYDALSIKAPIFGELRNCMDLAVVAALIVKERLAGRAGLSLGALLDFNELPTDEYMTPKQIATQANFVETRTNYIISASGGVAIDSWAAAAEKETSEALAPIREQVAGARKKNWWWN